MASNFYETHECPTVRSAIISYDYGIPLTGPMTGLMISVDGSDNGNKMTSTGPRAYAVPVPVKTLDTPTNQS